MAGDWTQAQEARFHDQQKVEMASAYRLALLIAAVLFPVGTILDWFTQPAAFRSLSMIRWGTTLVVTYGYAASGRIRKPYLAGLMLILFATLSISMMCVVVGGYQSPYYAGVNLVLLTSGVLFPWGYRWMGLCTGLSLSIYLSFVFYHVGFPLARPDIMINNLYFLGCTSVISVCSGWLSDRLRRDSFSRLLETEHAQARLKEYDRLKTQFFANVSHELRTPLTLILGPVRKLLSSRNGLPASARSDLEVVERNGCTLLKHVNDLLDVAKLDVEGLTPHYFEIDLVPLVRRVSSHFTVLSQEGRYSFNVETPNQLFAELDPEMLERMLMNLLSNAFKFTPQGGQVTCSLTRRFQTAVLSVSDSGSGIAEENRNKVFERFFQAEESATRRFGGTGLGLAIVKEFVELQGGSVEAAASDQGGALFTLSLPLKAPATAKVSKGGSPISEIRSPVLVPMRFRTAFDRAKRDDRPLILIVEDSIDLSEYIQNLLSPLYATALANDGEDGFKKAISLKPDLILTDMMMPKMSGAELTTKIRREPALSAVPIVVLTAKADDITRIKLLREGAQDYILKPFLAEEILARISNLLSIKNSREILQRELSSDQGDLTLLTREVASRKQELQEGLEQVRQAHLEAKRSLQLRDEFISIASHELRTPITSLKLQAQLLKRKFFTGSPEIVPAKDVLKIVEVCDRQAENLSHLVEDMLDVSRINQGKMVLYPESMDLADTVRAVVERLASQLLTSGCSVRLVLEAFVSGAWDRTRIDQVISHLIVNAMKFGAGKPIQIEAYARNGQGIIKVTDHGMGIAPEDQERVFGRFERAVTSTRISGMGLGLYLSRKILEAHEGSIQVQSVVGQGSTFTIYLPLERISVQTAG